MTHYVATAVHLRGKTPSKKRASCKRLFIASGERCVLMDKVARCSTPLFVTCWPSVIIGIPAETARPRRVNRPVYPLEQTSQQLSCIFCSFHLLPAVFFPVCIRALRISNTRNCIAMEFEQTGCVCRATSHEHLLDATSEQVVIYHKSLLRRQVAVPTRLLHAAKSHVCCLQSM